MTTQNCAECGTRAEPGQSFCDACGAVLGWTDRSPARTAAVSQPSGAAAPEAAGATSPAPAPAPGPARTGTADTPAAPAGSDSEDTAENPLPPVPASDDTAPTEPVPAATAPTVPTPEVTAAAADADAMNARARSLLVPVTDPEARPTPPPSVSPVLPGRPVADRPQVRAPGPQQGDENGVACPWCSTPNRPDRHYCTRCAMPMTRTEDTSARHRPWWRRVLDFRNRETPWAGDRPRLRRTFDRILTWVVAAAVLSLLIWVGVSAPGWVQATRDHFAKRAPVAPDQFTASRSYPGHKPDLLFDKVNNTWWGPGVTQSGEGQWIEARFAEPTRLLDLIITPGTSTRADQLSQSALPHRIKVTITTKDGRTTTRNLTLDQSAGGQRRAFRVGEVTKVRFTLESAYGASASKQVAIAEIEFFGRSSANSS
ncbi:zinc ribbon domain-containing protein [Streptomyces phaeoluteigriseus]|uniref:Zinc ribbon domain-containing protein n=1 Tax=Streptomyces phaeoluteigriseus TaxID=114686 RepID=A0ABY4Z0C9_9ACTN|nr:zinc ribbon domain-containing protein [Streptomyces phaeoluteigriseus]USQ82420.1 zinc ribbon domain-containing protein [Streptomyces phaeoluteigriseus]